MVAKRAKQPEGLLSVLADRSAQFGDRDDAAMDLCAFDQPEVEAALIAVVTDPCEDPDIVDSAGESLREIWRRGGKFESSLVSRMRPEARKFFEA
jgi:hypothetical protein